MRRTLFPLLLALPLLAVACGQETPVTVTTDTREPVAVYYVGAPELPVHAKADDASKVLTTFLNGESVSVLAKHGEWVEVRTAAGTGFARMSDLATAAEAKKEADNPSPKFRKAPSPISGPGIHGTIYIEAEVNTEGEVGKTTLITNTTGSPDLAERNTMALRLARFYPIVQKGERKPFLYYYRVDY
jgi:uncharacterized protein YgiM (DUF1202 family)